MNIQEICTIIDKRKDELFALLCDLIKFNSESHFSTGNEKALAEHIYKLCVDMGLEAEIYSPLEIDGFTEHPDYMEGRGLENRLNVTVRMRGKEDRDALMLMGHTDTVEIGDVNNWEFDPLCATISDGKIFGRGACDDKYAVATALFILKILKQEGVVLKKNLLFSAYCDEEYGGSHGALASALRYPSDRIVNMDGRKHEIWNCASGGQEAKFTFHTVKTADSAKYVALAIPTVLEIMDTFAQNRKIELEENKFYRGTRIPSTALRYMGIRAGNNGMDLGVGEIHFTYYTVKTKDEIYAEFKELEKVMNEKLEPLGVVGDGFRPHTRFFHYVHCEPDCEAIVDLLDAAKEAGTTVPKVCGSCLSDLSVIAKYGSDSAFAFGAGRDFSLPGGAHQPNEYIGCDELLEFAKTIAAYVIKILG